MRRKICFCPCEESSGGLKKHGLQGLFGVSPQSVSVCKYANLLLMVRLQPSVEPVEESALP